MAAVLCSDVIDSDDEYLVPFPRKASFKSNLNGSKVNAATKMENFTERNLKSCLQRCTTNTEDPKVDSTNKRIKFKNLISSDDEELFGDKLTEVTISGEVVTSTECISLELTFMTYSICLEMFHPSEELFLIHWPLNEIRGFGSSICPQTNVIVLELELNDPGVERLQSKLEDFEFSIGNPFVLKVKDTNWNEQERRITSLSDGYKCLWRPMKMHQSKQCLLRMNEKMNNEIFIRRHGINMTSWVDLVFPKGMSDAVTITKSDYLLLDHQDYVNDTIIDFYIRYLENGLPENQRQYVHFYNSFFFQKLAKQDISDKCSSTFNRVKRWTKHVNIFDKHFLIIPVMQSAHWSLIVVCHPGNLFGGEHNQQSNFTGTCILHFDSMRGCHKGLEIPIKKYLVEHWDHRYSVNVPRNKKKSYIRFVRPHVPQQNNCFDCGLFMLHYIEMFIKAFCLKQPTVEVSSKWFDPAEVSNKRAQIQKVIRKLQKKGAKF